LVAGVRLAAHTIMPYLLISVIEHLKVTGTNDLSLSIRFADE
jgi:hypothetical protein